MRKTDAEYQSNYRTKLEEQGLVRYEIQIQKQDKVLFEKLASAISTATAKHSSTNHKRNLKQAKANLFHQLLSSKAVDYKELKKKLDHNEAILGALPSHITPVTDPNLLPIPKSNLQLTSDKKAQQIIADLQTQNYKLNQHIINLQYWLDRYKDICEVYEKETTKAKS